MFGMSGIGRRILGFLAGYFVSALSSIAWFTLSGHLPHLPAPVWFMVLTAVYGIGFAILGGYVAAKIGVYGTGVAVGVAIAIISVFSWVTDIGAAHWSQPIALFLMAPAAVFGARRARSAAGSNEPARAGW